jgi:hypothetical protein
VPIVPELALELKRLMAAQGFYRGKLDDSWDPAIQVTIQVLGRRC